MQKYHIINGDCLAEQLKTTSIEDDFIICRECLVDGEVKTANLDDFWDLRAKHITKNHQISVSEYFIKTVNEFNKIENIPKYSEVHLWFENDLFCQVNMWFCLSLLANRADIIIFRIFPITESSSERWQGFSKANTEDLQRAYAQKIAFKEEDIALGLKLWDAYRNQSFKDLKRLSTSKTDCFQHLEEVCQAHLDRFPIENNIGRPERVIKDILDNITNDFYPLFRIFSEREGVYGFGDSQVKQLIQNNGWL